ncbi:MAG: hypothetical protein AB1898_25220 [Acidobacteriota bacterium]
MATSVSPKSGTQLNGLLDWLKVGRQESRRLPGGGYRTLWLYDTGNHGTTLMKVVRMTPKIGANRQDLNLTENGGAAVKR